MNNFYVYSIFNNLNGKIYVGKTKDPQKRLKKHIKVAISKRMAEKFVIHKAILKYGIDNFTFSVLQCFNNEISCSEAEVYWIKYFQSNIKNFGYNLTNGGEGCSGRIISEETRQKQREKAIGRKHTKETLSNISGDNNHRSKLTFNEIKEIRNKYNLLKQNLVSLSKYYKVSSRTIAKVIYNQDWYDENYIPPLPRKINSNGMPKLTQEKANEIRKMHDTGINFLELSKLFNVTKENIYAIIAKKIWRNNE